MTSADWKEWASAILQALATPDRADPEKDAPDIERYPLATPDRADPSDIEGETWWRTLGTGHGRQIASWEWPTIEAAIVKWLATPDRADLRALLKDDVRKLAFLTPEDWRERRGGDPIARTINAVFDIIDARLATPDRADLTEAEEHIIVEPDGTAIYPGGTTWPEDATPDRADNPLDYESEWYRKGWEAGRADALATPDRADHCSECRKSWPHDGCCHEHATPDRADPDRADPEKGAPDIERYPLATPDRADSAKEER